MCLAIATSWALVHQIPRILEQVAISFSRESSWPRDGTLISCTGRWILYLWASKEMCHLILLSKFGHSERRKSWESECILHPEATSLKLLLHSRRLSLSALMLLFNQNIKNNYITLFSLLTQWIKSLFTFLLVCYLQYILYQETLGLFEPVIILWKCWEQQETKPRSLFKKVKTLRRWLSWAIF